MPKSPAMDATPDDATRPMTPLERGQLGVLRFQSAIMALQFLVVGGVAEAVLMTRGGWPVGAITAPLVAVAAYLVLIAPGRRYRAWGYAVGNDELRVAHGVWTRVETHVPLTRVQHIDVSQGPVERRFQVCRLILHTAGTLNSRVVLPGLARTTAEAIRDDVRARIRSEEP